MSKVRVSNPETPTKSAGTSEQTSKSAWAHDHTRIRAQAYALYEQRGRQEGRALEDWLNAERQVVGTVYNS